MLNKDRDGVKLRQGTIYADNDGSAWEKWYLWNEIFGDKKKEIWEMFSNYNLQCLVFDSV